MLELIPPTGWRDIWSARLGLDWSEIDSRLEVTWKAGELGHINLREAERQIATALGLSDAALARFMNDMWTEYLGTLNLELADYFKSLRPRFRTGVLSNGFVGAREREQHAYGFEDICDVIVYSQEEGFKKPDAHIYEIVLRQLDVRPHEALFLDDVESCVDGARRVGMDAVQFIGNEQAIADLESYFNSPPT